MDAGLTFTRSGLGRPPATCARQRGVVLFIALIVMVAMALAGLALVRSVDTNVIVAGNIGFKQGAVNAGDQGLEAARTWLVANKDTLSDDQLATGVSAYISNWQDTIDLTGNDPARNDFDWNNNSLEVTADDGAGNRVRYVIHRLCATSNTPPSSTTCVKLSSTGGGAPPGGEYGGRFGYQGGGSSDFSLSNTNVFYRVTVRIDGPRKTASYVQAMMY
jgi:type IV pilus assembly protein PilX